MSLSKSSRHKIPISEIFYSLQGEGVRSGVPSVFIRFWGCNLSCDFCDSRFSWDTSIEKPKSMPLEDIIHQIKSFPVSHLVFTGGEPMLRQKDIRNICEAIKPEFVEIETNGTQKSDIDDCVDQFNISPKFDFKNPILLQPNQKAFWKFVIRNQSDIKKADDFCNSRKILKSQILFQPEGRTKKEIMCTMNLVISAAQERGIRISPRLHILLWDDKRAV